MSYSCKILLDSISETGKRITTFEITFPRCVLAEAETHRVLRGWNGNVEELIIHNLGINVDENLSRNSASSRAIPINKMIQRVKDDPFIPKKWGKPVAGMGAKEYWPLNSIEHLNLTMNWTIALDNALRSVECAKEFGNKEDLNRLLEPFMYHTAIITATEFDNFFKLRTNSAADWKIRRIADLMYEAYHAFSNLEEVKENDKFWNNNSNEDYVGNGWYATRPQKLGIGEWHCPLVYEEDDEAILEFLRKTEWPHSSRPIKLRELAIYGLSSNYVNIKKKTSVARCARISYLTHDGKRDIEKDLELYEKLVGGDPKHASPLEHVATPYFLENIYLDEQLKGSTDGRLSEGFNYSSDLKYLNLRSGNFIGWKQWRSEFPDNNCTYFRK